MTSFAPVSRTNEVYDRYGLLIFPAAAFFAGIGWSVVLSYRHRTVRTLAVLAIGTTIGLDARHLLVEQRAIGRIDSYGQAQRWLTTHLNPGDSVAVNTHYPGHLPRCREQLQALIAEREGPEAYSHKMQSLGYYGHYPEEAMRAAILNDESYASFWLRRELSGRRSGEGFRVLLYHHKPRFNSIPRREAIARFRGESILAKDQIDALLLNAPIDIGVRPNRVFGDQTGYKLYLYLQTPAAAEAATTSELSSTGEATSPLDGGERAARAGSTHQDG